MPDRPAGESGDGERFFTVTVEVPAATADLFTGILVQLGARGLESIPDEGLALFPEVEPPRPGHERLVATFRDAGADERAAVERSLAAAAGNRTLASRALGISVRTLRNKIRLYGLA